MHRAIVPIVEGHAEVESVPVLVRRILDEQQVRDVEVARPFRVKRNKVTQQGEIERALQKAIGDRDRPGAVLVLLDADDDCPAELGPRLLERCQAATRLPVRVVIAARELEGWFLGAKDSLRGVRGIRESAEAPLNPQSIRGAKERLSGNMEGKGYLEVDDQPALAARMDFSLAQERCPSFWKLLRDVRSLVEEMRS